tara:strand:- start:1504 stop:2538 length:1035 start_codon:yes stop_codon:yes gene_type:complete
MIEEFTHKEIEKIINYKAFKNLKVKNILITGCGGFIGGYLTSALLSKKNNKKFNIYGMDIIKPNLNPKIVATERFFFIKRDLTKVKNFNFKRKMDIVIHLAGIPSPTYYKKHPLKTYYLNSDLSKIFLEYAKKNNSKFVYFSSSEIYGNPDSKNIPTKETYDGRVSSISDRSCYDESKRSGETFGYIYKNYFKMDVKIIRPFNFYGNGTRINDKRIIPQFFFDALHNKKINVFSNGKQTRTYCNIIDAIPVIIKICFFGKKFVYNVGNSNNETSAFGIAKIIKKIIGDKSIKIKKIKYPKDYPSNEPRRRCPDISSIKKEFNYKPKINLAKGLKYFYNYFNKAR